MNGLEEGEDVMEEESCEDSEEGSDFEDDESDDEDDAPVPMMANPPMGGNQHALLASFLAQMPPAAASAEPDVAEPEMMQEQQAPEEVWENHLGDVSSSITKSLKATDEALAWFFHMLNQLQNNEPVDVSMDIDTPQLFDSLKDAIESNTGLTHIIFGARVWQLFSTLQQQELLRATKRHALSLRYFKMGSDSETAGPLGGPSVTETLLHALVTTGWKWTELEFRGMYFYAPQHIEWFRTLLRQTPTLKQVNVLNFYLHQDLCEPSTLDPILETVSQMPQLDELRLCRSLDTNTSTVVPALISPEAWQSLLAQKPKWWRLALDGLGLDDRHGHLLAAALQASPQCKMGDLLSLRHNPNLRDYASIMRACFCKQRMGEVSVDDESWVATFHLVRSMNNLHRRLEYVMPETGGYPSRDRWIEWLAVLGNIGWQDEAHRVNYLWFTLLEKPEFLRPQPTTTTT